MNEISIFDAWTLWLSGRLSPNLTLWGVSIFWWGRFGKIMQVVGAVTIVADIVGPEKIRSLGNSLHSAITPTILMEFLNDCFEWYKVVFRHTFMKDYVDEAPAAKKHSNQFKINILNYLTCFLLTILVIFAINPKESGWVLFVEAAIIFFCLLVSLSPLVTVLFILAFIATGLMINAILIQSLAWFLEHPALDKLTKLASLLLLLIGFHFELLAS